MLKDLQNYVALLKYVSAITDGYLMELSKEFETTVSGESVLKAVKECGEGYLLFKIRGEVYDLQEHMMGNLTAHQISALSDCLTNVFVYTGVLMSMDGGILSVEDNVGCNWDKLQFPQSETNAFREWFTSLHKSEMTDKKWFLSFCETGIHGDMILAVSKRFATTVRYFIHRDDILKHYADLGIDVSVLLRSHLQAVMVYYTRMVSDKAFLWWIESQDSMSQKVLNKLRVDISLFASGGELRDPVVTLYGNQIKTFSDIFTLQKDYDELDEFISYMNKN